MTAICVKVRGHSVELFGLRTLLYLLSHISILQRFIKKEDSTFRLSRSSKELKEIRQVSSQLPHRCAQPNRKHFPCKCWRQPGECHFFDEKKTG